MEFDQYHKNEGFDISEQIELFIRWIFENWKLQYGRTKWTFETKYASFDMGEKTELLEQNRNLINISKIGV